MGKKNKPTDVFQHIDMSGGPDACWPWKRPLSTSGRPYFDLHGKKVLAYRLVYELFTGEPIPDGLDACHSCDNEVCCNYKHITPGTRQKNMDDMKERERHGLTHHAVRHIKKLLDAGRKQQEIAELYGISRESVSAIATGRTYGHVKDEE